MMEERKRNPENKNKSKPKQETNEKRDYWDRRRVKRTKNIMTKESKGSQQTTKVSFLNQVMMMAGFCKQKAKELF